MPFFYVPGNHDLANKTLVDQVGRAVRQEATTTSSTRTCCSCACAPRTRRTACGTIDKEQQEWVAKTLDGEQGRALDVRVPAQADLERRRTWRRTAGRRSRRRWRAGSTPSSAATSTATRSSIRNGTELLPARDDRRRQQAARRRVRRVRPRRLGHDEEGRPAHRQRHARRHPARPT